MSVEALAKSLLSAIGENNENQGVTDYINTGFTPLNNIICGDYKGGLPQGRMVEMYGPSSSGKTAIATMMMIEAQRVGGIAGFMDHERSFDIDMAKKMGLKDEFPFWIYKQPKTWEQSNTMMAKAAETIRASKVIPINAPILFVFDSIAAANPKSVVEKDFDELSMNDTTALARVTSTTLKSMAAFTEQFNFTVLYLNQIRTKPGVVYGDPTCLRGDVMIPFVDGTTANIATIVERKIDKPIWSLNESSGQMEPKRIIGWHDNGIKPDSKKWIHVRSQGVGTKNGVIGMTLTDDHQVMTASGWRRADELVIGDGLVTKINKKFTGRSLAFLKAVMAFDCSLVQPGKNRLTACLSLQDNNDPEYAYWKVKMLSNHLGFTETPIKWKGGSGVKFVSEFSNELRELANYARSPLNVFAEGISNEQLAIAIMDDAHYDGKNGRSRYSLSLRRFAGNFEYLDDVGELLAAHGLTFSIRYGSGRFDFDNVSSIKIAEAIAPYVPPCMQHKLPDSYRDKYVEIALPVVEHVDTTYSYVTEVREGSLKEGRQRMYDITVEDNHNFLAGSAHNGVVVHNCTPGGGSMEFYASVRIALGRKKIMEERGGEKVFVGQEISMKTTKNKLTRPFQEISLRMTFDENGSGYFDITTSLVEFLVAKGRLVASGPRITWIDGKSYFKKALVQHINDNNLQEELNRLVVS